jgi:hypothetical protein
MFSFKTEAGISEFFLFFVCANKIDAHTECALQQPFLF